MTQSRPSLVGRTLNQLRALWRRRRNLDRRRGHRAVLRSGLRIEPLESREVMTADPTLALLPNIVLNGGSPQWVPLDGFDADGGTLTFTATSQNPGLVSTSIPTGNRSIKMSVAGFGDMTFQLFENMVPRVTGRIIDLVNSGFYDDTATNTITFHRILNDFVIQAGDPTGTGSGGSTLGDFDDQFHVDLQHNRSGLLSMAKTTDDTNDSQFFITEERNERQFIKLTGNPTGGTFTLTYFDQVTAPITFSNSADFNTIAASIQSALEGLTRIGAGNVIVTHEPELNQQSQVTENRRWRVEFIGTLAHQEVVNLVGADNLTGGTNPAVSITEQKSARHLDFNHSIFGLLTQGESVRDAISNVTTDTSGTPANPPVISNIDVIVDPENGALLLKAAEGASGETDITVRVTDPEGHFAERTFHVLVTPDGINGAPFLQDIAPIRGTSGQQIQIPLVATDVENQAFTPAAAKPAGNTVNYTLNNVDAATGNLNDGTNVVKITPPAGFVGLFDVLVGVRGTVATDTGDPFDTEIVTVTVAPTPPTNIDLLAASDSGFSNSDNITNAGTLQFQITGVTNGALVKLKKGTTVVAQGTASGTTITLNVASTDLGEGLSSLRATQTVTSIESDLSAARDFTVDTTPPGAFTSTPPTEGSVGQPLVYNADAPGEGTAGFIYSLTTPPTGATINGVNGQLTWTPAANQAGNHVFQIVATDAAGNATQQTLNISVDEPLPFKIGVILELTKPDGSPLTSLDANQNFVLHMFVEDLRNEFQFIRLDGDPLGGSFTLSFGNQTTQPIAFDNAGNFTTMAASIESALEALPGIGLGNVIVTHVPQLNQSQEITENRRWKVEFVGALAHQEVTNLTGNAAGLTGGTAPAITVTESTQPAGVASVYVDILFDPAKAEATGPITFGQNYQLFQSGSTGTPGLIDELGAFGPITGFLGAGKFEMASIPMKAKQSGLLTFTTEQTDDPGGRAAGVYGENTAVPFELTRYGTASITVDATFQAVNDTVNVNEDAQNQTLNPLANDTIDPGSGNVLTIQSVGATNHGGTVQITQNSTRLSYTPAHDFFGTETFTYTVKNQNNETSTATITVQVQPQNDLPVAVNDTAVAAPGGSAVVINVLANDTVGVDTNENVQNYVVSAVTQPAQGGTVAITPGAKSVTFTPAAGQFSNVTFTYTISDGHGGTATATVTINNDNPIAVNDTPTVAEDSTGNVLNVLTNDTPGTGPNAGTNLTVTAVGATNHGGTVTPGQNGTTVVYTPAANFQGTETFTYTISDGNNHTATATVTVTVTNSNDPPTANDDSLTAFKNTAAVFNVLANDSFAPDPAETLTIDSVTQPSHGTVSITNNGTRITYTPTTDYTGPDSFTYIIKDASGASSLTATVNLSVQEFIPSSLAGFVYFDVDNDGIKDASESVLVGVTITLTGTDVNNAPVNRTLETGEDGSYKFDQLLPGNYTITESQPAFTIDGKEKVGSQGGTSTQNDKIVIANLAQNTNGTGNNFGERGRQASLITLRDFFARSSKNYVTVALDAAGTTLWHSLKGTPFAGYTNPIVSLINNQINVEGTNAQSQPVEANLPLTDTRIRLLGASGGNKLFQINAFNLANPTNNTPPTAVNDSFTTNEDTTLTVAVANGVLKNDTDPNSGQTLTAVVVTQPAHGTLTLNPNGSFTYVPTGNYNGPDSFTYKASDGIAQSAAATVNITVTAVNDAPVANANSYTATQNTARTVNQTDGVLTNDTDQETASANLTALIVTQPAHGTVTLNANGSFTYTPASGYTGPDSFTYRASDGSLQSSPATVSIAVEAAGSPEGEGGSASQSAALMAFLASGDDAADSGIADDGDWPSLVDRIFAR